MNEIKRTPIPTPGPPAGGNPKAHLRPDQLPGAGRPPIPSGQVAMTDYTRSQLLKLGWRDGDPIPGDLGQRIQEIQQEIAVEKSKATPDVPADWKPVRPKTVDISELPEAHQKELREYLQTYKKQEEERKAREDYDARLQAQVPEGASPSVAAAQIEAMRVAHAAQAQRESQRSDVSVAIVEDVVEVGAPPPGVTIPPGRQYGGALGSSGNLQEKIEAAAAKQREVHASHQQRVVEEEAEPPPDTGTELAIKRCPRCLWDMRMAFDADPTTSDKEVFMAAVLGMQRFTKRLEILGGKMALTFRSLTTHESAQISKQLAQHIQHGEIKGDGEYFAMLMDYRLVLSLSKVESLGHVLSEVPDLKEWAKDKPTPKPAEGEVAPATALPAMREWFHTNVVSQEHLRRVIGQNHRQFQRLVEALEALTAESDFWTGIEPRG